MSTSVRSRRTTGSRRRWPQLLTIAIFAACGTSAGGSGELFSVDAGEEQQFLENQFTKADEQLNATKLQDLRSTISLAEYHFSRVRKQLSREDAASVQSKIDAIKQKMNAKVDSLVSRNLEIMKVQGIDSAVQFLQQDMHRYGVPEEKLSAVDQAIADEAPKVKRAQEKAALARALQALQSGNEPDPSIDPYIASTARRIYKVEQDSIHAVEEKKNRKLQEEQYRQEKANLAREEKARKEEEKQQAKLKKEEEKRQMADQKEQERTKSEGTNAAAAPEKTSSDSAATAQNAQYTGAENEKHRLAMLREQAFEDSIAGIEQAQKQAHQAQKDSIESARQAALREKIRADSVATVKKEQDRLAKLGMRKRKLEREQQYKDSLLEAAQERKREDQARKDSLVAARQEALKEKARADSIASVERAQDQAQQYQARAQSRQAVQSSDQPLNEQPAAGNNYQPQPPVSPAEEQPDHPPQSAVGYLAQLDTKQKAAQEYVAAIYASVEKGDMDAAVATFRTNKAFIAQYVGPEVFNVLEQTVAQSMTPASGAPQESPAGASPESVEPVKERSGTEQLVAEINGFIRQNKIEAAYTEFKRVKNQLRKALTKEDFKALEQKVNTAYSYVGK